MDKINLKDPYSLHICEECYRWEQDIEECVILFGHFSATQQACRMFLKKPCKEEGCYLKPPCPDCGPCLIVTK